MKKEQTTITINELLKNRELLKQKHNETAMKALAGDEEAMKELDPDDSYEHELERRQICY